MDPPTKKPKSCNVTTFIVDNHLITSPNAGPFRSLPPDEKLSFYDDPDPNLSFSLNWNILDYPYMAYVISPPRYDHPLLQRLNYTDDALPIQGPPWKLKPSLASQWTVLEGALRFIIHKLLPESNQLYPLEFQVFHIPNTYGFLRTHRSERIARRAASRSRDAFVPLMALCSSLIGYFHGEVLPPDVEPQWVRALQGPSGLNPTWLELFRSSPIADFSGLYPRVGTLIHVKTWRYPHLTRVAINAGVPVWFCWTTIDCPLSRSPVPELEKYFPTYNQIMEALQTNKSRHSVNSPVNTFAAHEIECPLNTMDVFTPASSHTFPEPRPESRQKRGETWMDFFKREQQRHNLILDRENSKERSARLARQKHAEKFEAPGRKGARVFLWQDVNGFLLRALVNRGEVEDLFEDTPHRHMRYNAFNNEWDICREFDPTAQVDDADPFGNDVDEDEPGEIAEYDAVSTKATPAPIKKTTIGVTFSQAVSAPAMEDVHQDIFAMFGRGVSHGADVSPTFVGSLDYQLYLRFGFDCEETQQPIPVEWARMRNTLQDTQSPVRDTFTGPITEFVTSLLKNSIDNLSAISWDLSPTSSSFLRERMGHRLSVDVQVVEVLESSRYRSNVIGLNTTLQRETTYLLRQPSNSNNSVNWLLAVPSAAATLQCIRFCSTGIVDVVRFCVERGIAFNTFTQVVRSQSRPCIVPHVTLGTRLAGYKPDAADYAAYEAARDRFLQSSSGRAALLKGGIVWRLAMEFITPGVVLAGPSDIASMRGRVIHISGVGNFCDDELSEDEADLICGVYYVRTGTRQLTHLSWWPKQSSWERSLYNVGYWTPMAETWFQKRLAAIRSGKEGCKKARDWEIFLPRNGNSLKLAANMEDAARRFIEG